MDLAADGVARLAAVPAIWTFLKNDPIRSSREYTGQKRKDIHELCKAAGSILFQRAGELQSFRRSHESLSKVILLSDEPKFRPLPEALSQELQHFTS